MALSPQITLSTTAIHGSRNTFCFDIIVVRKLAHFLGAKYLCDLLTLKLLSDCSTEIDSVKDLLTIAGLLAAAYYGYRRFLHGRLYSERLKPSLSLDIVVDGDRHWLIADVEIENTGLRRTRFKHRTCDVMFHGVVEADEADEGDRYPFFDHEQRFIATRPLFSNTSVIEPDEVSQEATAALIDAHACTGYVAEFRISEEKAACCPFFNLFRRSDSWVATAYRFLDPTKNSDHTGKIGLRSCRSYTLEKRLESLRRQRSGRNHRAKS